MKKKATGAQIREFWNTGFPEGYYYDGGDQGSEFFYTLNPHEKYDLSEFGDLIVEEIDVLEDQLESTTFQNAFCRWYEQQTTHIVVCSIPKGEANLAALKEAIKLLGGEVHD